MSKILTHPNTKASAVAGVVVAVGLVATGGTPVAWAVAALWAAVAAVGTADAARA